MDSETRQKRIEELKALRAVLMAYKESSEAEDGESVASNEKMASLRKEYASEYQDIQKSDTSKYEDVRQELYSQQEEHVEEKNEDKQLTLTRRR